MMTLSQIKATYPGIEFNGSESGKWIVFHCRYNQLPATRFDSYWEARTDFNSVCGTRCTKQHILVEITDRPAMLQRAREIGYRD